MKKRNLALTLSLVIIGLIGVVLLIWAYVRQGVDIWAWFGTKWGITILIFIITYFIIVGLILINDWRKRL